MTMVPTMVPTLITVVVLAIILTAPGQSADVPRPTQGHRIGSGSGSSGIDIIMPLSIAQCEPVLIYYDNSFNENYVRVVLETPDGEFGFLYFDPLGVGYLDWICNIPAGYSFIACLNYCQYYTVQPGTSSDCLGNVTTTYSYADYYTTYFQSYTQQSPSGDSSHSTEFQLSTIAFPTSSFPTITVNPNLAVTSTTASAVSSTLSASPVPSSPPPHKPNKAVVAGGIVGGLAFVLLTITAIFIFLRKRGNSHADAALESLTIESELKPYSGLMSSLPAPTTNLSAPLLPILDQGRPSSYTDSIDPVHRGSKFTPNIGRTAVPDTQRRNHIPPTTHPDPIAAVSRPPPKHKDNIPSNHSPKQSTISDPEHLGAILAPAFNAARLTTSQRLAFIAAMHSSADPAPPLADVQELTGDDTTSPLPPYAE